MSELSKEALAAACAEKVRQLEFSVKQSAFDSVRQELQTELAIARVALAALRERAEPVRVNQIAEQDRIASDIAGAYMQGCRDTEARLAKALPAPVVPDALEHLCSIVADPRALPRRKEWISGQQYSYVLLENVEAMVDEACRAAMLAAPGAPVVPDELVYKLLDIAKRAAEEADECAYVEFSDKSMKHAREIAEWERRAAILQPVSQHYKLPGKEG
ncbi:hypothetical protein [Cronobacter sakazakii]|uniref:hypothetical protein n=1 Tax=Cronobacter sakazakii TaxID=28141 RepID=UPI000E08068A|nr:hypothetical protein [Cronobacter sakazakii]STD04869.1 Uncharacterised protein [Cronobacter sakazakii]STE70535.1 Uncharacterised protein [Cronobacter sakazakii]